MDASHSSRTQDVAAMICETRSEKLFAAICDRHGYRADKLSLRSESGLKTADFAVQTPHGRFIAEIEELTPNDDDLRQIREMKEAGTTVVGFTIGSRARKAIRRAANQLRDHRDEGLPMIAILYDNVRTADGRVAYPMQYLEPHHIDSAMYGNLVVDVPLVEGAPKRPDRSGGGRTTTKAQTNYLSAVGVIFDGDDKTLFVYHNYHAEIEFPGEVFSDAYCHHYWKGLHPHGEPWKWHDEKPG